MFSEDRINELRGIFFESSQEILQSLNEDALAFEKNPRDPELVRNLRRSVHTLKGDAAACGYKDFSELAHAVEDVLSDEIAARKPTALVEVVLTAADMLDNLLVSYRSRLQPPSTAPLYQLIDGLRQPNQHGEKQTVPENDVAPWTAAELAHFAQSAVRGQQAYRLRLTLDPNCAMPLAAVQLVRTALEQCGTILAMHPDSSSAPRGNLIEAIVVSHHPLAWIESKSRIPTIIAQVSGQPLTAATTEPAATNADTQATVPTIDTAQSADEATALAAKISLASAMTEAGTTRRVNQTRHEAQNTVPTAMINTEAVHQTSAQSQRQQDRERAARLIEQLQERKHDERQTDNVIRVDVERIDAVLDLVGELIITKSMFLDLLNEVAKIAQHSTLRKRSHDLLARQSQILNKLQRAVMKIRLVPVEQMFRRLPRVVRDAAKQAGRSVDIVIEGEGTDLDKSVLDALAEPMMHLLRNAVDHGIEPSDERVAQGKPPAGTIRLTAYHQGNQVILEVADDGRGVDSKRVVEAAIARGLVAQEQAARMSENERLELIFAAGLSTSPQVTELSGRGVGMDVVKSVLDRLKGSVTMRSVVGQGTTFRLQVPLTLAIIKALLFRVCEHLYAVPLGNVTEILRCYEKDVHVIDGQEVVDLRNQVVPILRLNRLHHGQTHGSKLFLIVVSFGDRRVGLAVDKLLGEQELFIKAIDDTIMPSDLVSGASILGDGRVVLILSIAAVVEKLGHGLLSLIADNAAASEVTP